MKSLKHRIYISIHVYEEFKDTKEVTKILKSKRNNRRNKKEKTTNKDLKNTTQKCKDRPKQTPLITGFNSGYSGSAVPAPLVTSILNEERTGKCLRQVENSHGYL